HPGPLRPVSSAAAALDCNRLTCAQSTAIGPLPEMQAPSIMRRRIVATCILLVGSIAVSTSAEDASLQSLERRFSNDVRPFLKKNCVSCHGPEKPKAKLDLSAFASLGSVVKNQSVWALVLERLEAEEMPPERAARYPTPHERHAVIEW